MDWNMSYSKKLFGFLTKTIQRSLNVWILEKVGATVPAHWGWEELLLVDCSSKGKNIHLYTLLAKIIFNQKQVHGYQITSTSSILNTFCQMLSAAGVKFGFKRNTIHSSNKEIISLSWLLQTECIKAQVWLNYSYKPSPNEPNKSLTLTTSAKEEALRFVKKKKY